MSISIGAWLIEIKGPWLWSCKPDEWTGLFQLELGWLHIYQELGAQ